MTFNDESISGNKVRIKSNVIGNSASASTVMQSHNSLTLNVQDVKRDVCIIEVILRYWSP